MAEFVNTMNRLAQPDYLPHSFFIEGGGLAVENALKAAFDWKVKKNLNIAQKIRSPLNLLLSKSSQRPHYLRLDASTRFDAAPPD